MNSEALELLGDEAESLLTYEAKGIRRERLHLPGPNFVSEAFGPSDRNPRVLRSLEALYSHGRLGGTGYLSILPVDQGVEHSGGASFSKNPDYFDPEKIVELAIEGGCNGVTSTFGVLGMVARKYAHKIPFIVKVNHNQLLTYPAQHAQTMFGQVERAFDMGAVAVGATIYFGSEDSNREIREVGEAFTLAHELGMATVLWCYTRNSAFKSGGVDYHSAADLTGQAIHLGVTLQADIIKQKLPENNHGFTQIGFGRTDPIMYEELMPGDHPIELVRWQVANSYMGRVGMINSGGPSGDNDYADAVRTAVLNKRGGGAGLISGRKAFQRSMRDGVRLLNLIQDVYLDEKVTVA